MECQDELKQKYYCSKCDFTTYRKNNFMTHLKSKRHLSNDDTDDNTVNFKFYCDHCSFKTNRKFSYLLHLKTNKHIKNFEANKQNDETNHINNENISKQENENENIDENGHENDNEDENMDENEVKTLKNLVFQLVSQTKCLLDAMKENNQVINTTNHNNNNNNTFNIQVFLNETCKDAINMKDFIESIEVSIADLKILGKRGYVEGISGLMIKKLNDLDVTKRPIHSSDTKRETIYIKDNDIWEKDDDQKERLRKVLWEIARLETQALEEKFKVMYPQCETDRDCKEHNEFWKIFHNAMGGDAGEVDVLQKKVIKRLVQNVMIDKKYF